MQYIALIHKNADTTPTSAEWNHFFKLAAETSMFQGGSEVGVRRVLGYKEVPDTTKRVGGYMRFDSEDLDRLVELLDEHPVIKHGGTIELCEMPETNED
jgi:hypothetical protein